MDLRREAEQTTEIGGGGSTGLCIIFSFLPEYHTLGYCGTLRLCWVDTCCCMEIVL